MSINFSRLGNNVFRNKKYLLTFFCLSTVTYLCGFVLLSNYYPKKITGEWNQVDSIAGFSELVISTSIPGRSYIFYLSPDASFSSGSPSAKSVEYPRLFPEDSFWSFSKQDDGSYFISFSNSGYTFYLNSFFESTNGVFITKNPEKWFLSQKDLKFWLYNSSHSYLTLSPALETWTLEKTKSDYSYLSFYAFSPF